MLTVSAVGVSLTGVASVDVASVDITAVDIVAVEDIVEDIEDIVEDIVEDVVKDIVEDIVEDGVESANFFSGSPFGLVHTASSVSTLNQYGVPVGVENSFHMPNSSACRFSSFVISSRGFVHCDSFDVRL